MWCTDEGPAFVPDRPQDRTFVGNIVQAMQQAQANALDQWSYYQAKGIKAAVAEASRTAWLAIAKEPPAEYARNHERYLGEHFDLADPAGVRDVEISLRAERRPPGRGEPAEADREHDRAQEQEPGERDHERGPRPRAITIA